MGEAWALELLLDTLLLLPSAFDWGIAVFCAFCDKRLVTSDALFCSICCANVELLVLTGICLVVLFVLLRLGMLFGNGSARI